MERKTKLERKTRETNISVEVNLDGKGNYNIDTPIGFLNHMLELFSKHSLIDLNIKAEGDIHVDYHHLVEDLAIVMGKAINEALGKKEKIERYGFFILPMDESLVEVVVDLSGRPYLVYNVKVSREKIGDFDTELFKEFFIAFTHNIKANIHINLKYGENTHHIFEAVFKGLAKALRMAITINPNIEGINSTKGIL